MYIKIVGPAKSHLLLAGWGSWTDDIDMKFVLSVKTRLASIFFNIRLTLFWLRSVLQVGSTGVGALTVAFVIFAVSTIVFLSKANVSAEQRK